MPHVTALQVAIPGIQEMFGLKAKYGVSYRRRPSLEEGLCFMSTRLLTQRLGNKPRHVASFVC